MAVVRAALETDPVPTAPEVPAPRRIGASAVAAVLVIVALAAFAALAVVADRGAAGARASARADALSDAYQDASHAATVEQSLERAWRLGHEPGVVPLQRRAANDVSEALDRIDTVGTRHDHTSVVSARATQAAHLAAWDAELTRTGSGRPTEATSESLQDQLSAGAQSSYEMALRRRTSQDGSDLPVLLLLGVAAAAVVCACAVLVVRHVAIARDLRRLERRTERLALNDSLTGLPNRIVLRDRLEQALLSARREGTSAALLVIDLDSFKEINDALGHDYGDLLLAQIGPRLLGPLRSSDTVSRTGGDEFAVLLPRVSDLGAALLVAEKLQEALAPAFDVNGLQLSVEASIGVAIAPAHGLDAGTLMQRADVAMYVATDGGLGISAYDQALDGSSPRRAALLSELRRAVDENELFLVYQPKCSAATGLVEGVEALVRWQHPERGLLLPDEFLPLAERTGLIHPLTRHVLVTALADCRRWLDAGVQLPVAVNLSARTLLDRGFAGEVEQMLSYWRVPGHLLELEVTETALMADPARARTLLDRLSGLGVVLAIDDFGTGYSSLASLRELPVDDVKIDRSFVTPMLTSPNDAFIVRSVIALAHDVGLRVVAEGVEDTETQSALAELGCDVVQGFAVGMPLTASELESELAARHLLVVGEPSRRLREPARPAR